jgi:hypothetical protein
MHLEISKSLGFLSSKMNVTALLLKILFIASPDSFFNILYLALCPGRLASNAMLHLGSWLGLVNGAVARN